jgi:hypothetical protein
LEDDVMKRLTVAPLTLAIVLLTTSGQDAAEKPKGGKPKAESLMQQKLGHANKILAAIATEDFDAIRQNAEALLRIARLKEFDRATPRDYRAQLLIFDFASGELLRFGKEKNLDGAALAYTQLTLSCVNCHKHLRAP